MKHNTAVWHLLLFFWTNWAAKNRFIKWCLIPWPKNGWPVCGFRSLHIMIGKQMIVKMYPTLVKFQRICSFFTQFHIFHIEVLFKTFQRPREGSQDLPTFSSGPVKVLHFISTFWKRPRLLELAIVVRYHISMAVGRTKAKKIAFMKGGISNVIIFFLVERLLYCARRPTIICLFVLPSFSSFSRPTEGIVASSSEQYGVSSEYIYRWRTGSIAILVSLDLDIAFSKLFGRHNGGLLLAVACYYSDQRIHYSTKNMCFYSYRRYSMRTTDIWHIHTLLSIVHIKSEWFTRPMCRRV